MDLGSLALARDADEADLAAECLAAGCDLLVGVTDVRDVLRACAQAVASRFIDAESIRASVQRVNLAATFADVSSAIREPTLDDTLWARRAADSAIHLQRGDLPALRGPIELVIIDDDPPRFESPGATLHRTLKTLGVDARMVRDSPAADSRTIVTCVFGDRRLALGFDAYSEGALARVAAACANAEQRGCDSIVVHFTPPDFSDAFASARNLVCAWNGSAAMEEAVARRLARAVTT